MTFTNIINAAKDPLGIANFNSWSTKFRDTQTLYVKKLNLNQAKFMDATFSGRLDEEKIKKIRDLWKGKLVLKELSLLMM